MPDLSHEEAHEIARRGTSKVAWVLVKLLMMPVLRLLFMMRVTGRENVPDHGPAVIAPNHKSFWDAFFVSAVTKRRIFFMGKSELFRGRRGRFLLLLGGFPVKRGESDGEAIATAKAILARGDVLALFPEGTRVSDPLSLGTPRRGAARIAIEAGAPIIPTAITGTEKRRWPLPRRVQIAFGEPVPVDDLSATPELAHALTAQTLWPTIDEDYRRLRARPGVIAAGVAAVGLGVLVHKLRHRQ
ncbi:lysophospholipid acyltransferase family protein [Nocardioides jensenii]|uniref:lysophospholipid acyltransferase family protein n=1 Tax=Nocardioides jensenii TaxID=1843 RepID=UPI00082D0647|nr:lysophospholipid acyltransferase family protein [Nocardioides jensenii]